MQNVAATSNKRSMKNDQNPATTNQTITTARRPDNIRSSILVQGRSIRSMARSGCQPRRPFPERIHIFAILAGFRLRFWILHSIFATYFNFYTLRFESMYYILYIVLLVFYLLCPKSYMLYSILYVVPTIFNIVYVHSIYTRCLKF